ncbi:uncharacterized protein DNG_07795 [Cephalotrichum gorgonifer]|uniref:Uncharacterized protein n=1 Tax=Cephalotrichum gorgonifer TaxID=2041049 RepID=A0AAE8N5C7_9PEZI|nr:uncharacterized protein DNG_07795 [Cephalotrichum gorgonifer]
MLPKSGYSLLGGGNEGWSASMRNFLGFISTRVFRGRARLIIGLIILVNIICLGLVPDRLSTVVFGSDFDGLLRWRGSTSGHGSGGDGLRIVAFGSADFAMGHERRNSGSSKSWTEYLCDELRCSSYLSFVPQVDSRTPDPSMISNSLYKEALDNLLAQEFTADTPGFNYTYLRDEYPVPSHPDLAAQVSSFLNSRRPQDPPKETLWVFNFGFWDTWSLAALPREAAETIIDYMVLGMFDQIELLYRSSLSDTSVAFSDFWGYSSPEVIDKLENNRLGKSRAETEIFRVLIPETLDVSITPGWHSQRPKPPSPHSLAVHVTNAAYLTERWNAAVRAHVKEWEKLPHPNFDDVPSNGRAEARHKKRADVPAEEPLYAPFPDRSALVFNSPEFVLEAIIEKQMHDTGLVDSTGRGKRPPTDPIHFTEVWRPCSEGDDNGDEASGGWKKPCATPDEYLFQTPFSISDKGIREVARRAGEQAKETLYLGDAKEYPAEQTLQA